MAEYPADRGRSGLAPRALWSVLVLVGKDWRRGLNRQLKVPRGIPTALQPRSSGAPHRVHQVGMHVRIEATEKTKRRPHSSTQPVLTAMSLGSPGSRGKRAGGHRLLQVPPHGQAVLDELHASRQRAPPSARAPRLEAAICGGGPAAAALQAWSGGRMFLPGCLIHHQRLRVPFLAPAGGAGQTFAAGLIAPWPLLRWTSSRGSIEAWQM